MTATIYSSHGYISVKDDGTVNVNKLDKSFGEVPAKFDLEEYKRRYDPKDEHLHIDVLDIGYWFADGTYEPPVEEFRNRPEWL